MNEMNERLVVFGDRGDLVGILSEPAGSRRQPVACLFPNVGLAHRIGPHRLNVRISRALARAGLTSLRFDLSGIGDSPAARSSEHFMDQAVRDMKAAMDHLEAATGIRRFIVFGICSGAANGYFITQADPRVAGVLMLDGFRYPSLMARIANAFQLAGNVRFKTVCSRLARKIERRFSKMNDPEPAAALIDVDVDVMKPPMAAFRSSIESMIARGVHVYFIFSGSLRLKDRHRAFLSAFGSAAFLEQVRYDFLAEMDHTATPLATQHRLIEAVNDWAMQVAATAA